MNAKFFGVITIVAMIGYMMNGYMYLPGGLDIAFVAQVFLLIGNCIKKNMIIINDAITVILLLVTCILSFSENGRVDMNGRVYQNIFLFYLGGVSGSVLCMIIGKWISKSYFLNKILSYCGRNSLIVMIFHMFGFKILSGVFVLMMGISLEVAHAKYWILYSAFTLLFSLGIGCIVKEYVNISFKRFKQKVL